MNIKTYTRKCPQCNQEMHYKRKKDVNYYTKRKTICKTCSNNNRSKKGNYNSKEKFLCCVCSKEYMEWRSQISNLDKTYCSRTCKNKGMFKSLVGKKFGKLTVMSMIRDQNETIYICLCDCGSQCNITGSNLKYRKTQNCGCSIKEYRKNKRKSLKEILEKSIFGSYKRNARSRNYIWDLPYEKFVELINSNCYYCGIEKSNYVKCYFYEDEKPSLPFNGVDRIDNNIGYTIENSVPCCKQCNSSKYTLTFQEYKTWALRLSNHLIKNQNLNTTDKKDIFNNNQIDYESIENFYVL